ncbi:MAG: ABC transporter permease [Acutalibacteraceae bacterium]
MEFLQLFKTVLEEGFIYAILALGVYITYSILDFPDLSVDGTVPLGAMVSAVLILQGVNPWLCCLVSFCAGAAAGCVTGFLHVKLHIRPLLCGILVMTALLSVNLVISMTGTGGLSIVSFMPTVYPNATIFSSFPASLIPESIAVEGGTLLIRKVIVAFVLLLVCKFVLDWYLRTKSGLLLRATGSNEQYVTMLARNPGVSKIIGLALGNGFAALAGSVLAQQKTSADQNMGTGMVVLGLAAVIIGISLFGKLRFLRVATTMVILGSILYKACLQIALDLGLPNELLKLLMAMLLVIALVVSEMLGKGKEART